MKYGAVLDVALVSDDNWGGLIGAKGDTGSYINVLPDANIADYGG
jgi:hypothetical protein